MTFFRQPRWHEAALSDFDNLPRTAANVVIGQQAKGSGFTRVMTEMRILKR